MVQYITRRGPLAAIALIGYWLAMCVATHLPIRSPGMQIPFADKAVHFGGYALLGLLAAIVLKTPLWKRSTRYLALWSMIAAYGAVDELAQLMVPGRSADILDWLADLCGAAAGIGAFVLLRRTAIRFGWLNRPASSALTPVKEAAMAASSS